MAKSQIQVLDERSPNGWARDLKRRARGSTDDLYTAFRWVSWVAPQSERARMPSFKSAVLALLASTLLISIPSPALSATSSVPATTPANTVTVVNPSGRVVTDTPISTPDAAA